MKALFRFTLMAFLGLSFAVNLAAQCTSSSNFGNVSAPTIMGMPVTATTCAFGGEYSTFTGTTAGDSYTFSATGGTGNFLTIRQTTGTGTVVTSGLSPVTVAASPGGTLAVVVHTSAGCITDATCHTITAVCNSCPAPPPPPANDNCAGAIAFPTIPGDGTCATLMGNTTSATQSQSACAGSGADDDIWFSFVAPASTVIVDITAVSGNSDRVHQIFSGSCGSLVSVKCSDPETSTTTGLTVGATYYVRVHTYSTGNNTTFNMCIKVPPPPPANDNCAGALSVAVNPNLSCTSVTMGTVASATASTGPTSACGTYDDDVWFSFVATASTHFIELLNITGSTSDLTHQVLSSCGAATALVCSDPNTSTASGLTPGQTYFIRVASWTSTAGQTSSFSVCVKTQPPPPANDECAGAISLSVGASCSFAQYTTANATSSAGAPAPGCASYSGGDVWFSAVVPATGRLVLDSNTGGVTDGGMAIYSGNCGVLTLIECDDDDSANGLMPSIDRSGLTPGSTVYIRFWEYSNDNPGTFSICAYAPAPPCNAPGTPSASNISTNGATLSWAAASGAISYRYSFGTSGHTCGTGSTTTTGTSVNLSGLTPNTTYTFCVRTDDCGGGSVSSYLSTTFTTAPLPNDNCAGAIAVSCGSTVTGSTVGAVPDNINGSPCFASAGNGVWYTLAGDGSSVTLSLCGSSYDTKLAVYAGACGDLGCVASNDDFCGTSSQLTFVANAGNTYYILVSGFGSSSVGAFTMDIACECGPDLSAPWSVSYIGGAVGSAIDNVCGGTIDMAGNGIGTLSADKLNFASQSLCGNGSIIAKIENVTNGGWAGVMFRESSAAGSKRVSLRTQLSNAVTRDIRTTTNGALSIQSIQRPQTPQWLRVDRTGNTFVGYTSTDGTTWQQAFVGSVAMPNCIQMGLFVQGINVNSVATANFSNVSLSGTTPVMAAIPSGLQATSAEQVSFNLYPNPAQDVLNIKLEAYLGMPANIEVRNSLGQVVRNLRLDEVTETIETINLSGLPNGVYNISLQAGSLQPTSKQFVIGQVRP